MHRRSHKTINDGAADDQPQIAVDDRTMIQWPSPALHRPVVAKAQEAVAEQEGLRMQSLCVGKSRG